MKRLLFVSALLPCLLGCVHTYRYDGQAYPSREEAIRAVRSSNTSMLTRITPAANRIGGTLNFYVPEKSAIQERGVILTGKPPANLIDYVVEVASINHQALYDALVRRGAFDRVKLQYSQGEHIPTQNGEYMVYLYQPNARAAAWFFSSDLVKREQVNFDTSKSDRAEKIQYWLDSIEALAKVK